MAITQAEILAFVNKAVGEGTYSGTDLDIEIQMALDDLSSMHCIEDEDTSQSVTNASYYLDYPTRCIPTEQAIIGVVLTNSSGVVCAPLKHLPGGLNEYNRLMEAFSMSARSTPEWMVRQDQRIYLYPPPDDTYTSSIRCYVRHQPIADGVEFYDDWRTAVYFGAVYYTALLMNATELLNLWESRYYTEREKMRRTISRPTAIEGS